MGLNQGVVSAWQGGAGVRVTGGGEQVNKWPRWFAVAQEALDGAWAQPRKWMAGQPPSKKAEGRAASPVRRWSGESLPSKKVEGGTASLSGEPPVAQEGKGAGSAARPSLQAFRAEVEVPTEKGPQPRRKFVGASAPEGILDVAERPTMASPGEMALCTAHSFLLAAALCPSDPVIQ